MTLIAAVPSRGVRATGVFGGVGGGVVVDDAEVAASRPRRTGTRQTGKETVGYRDKTGTTEVLHTSFKLCPKT